MDVSMTKREPRLITKYNESDDCLEVCAEQITEYSGVFRNEYSLKSFPFDVQELAVEFRIPNNDAGVTYTCEDAPSKAKAQPWEYREDNSEWDAIDCWTSITNLHDSSYTEADAIVRMDRIYHVYIMRIVCVNFLVMILTIFIFVLSASEDTANRLGNSFTMLLTAVAYSLVVSDSLPTLGYLTWLDKYIFSTYFFIAVITTEFVVVGSSYIPEEHKGTIDIVFLVNDVLLLLGMHVYFYLTASALIKETKGLREDTQKILREQASLRECASSSSHCNPHFSRMFDALEEE